jgi:hypothetical protein
MILQWFMQQDNNIVKFCVVNQDEDVLGKWIEKESCLLVLNLVSSTLPCIPRPRPFTLLLHDWSIFDYHCNVKRAM